MQTRWTMMKLLILALTLFSMAWVNRTPECVTVRLAADSNGSLTEVEINGAKFLRDEWKSGHGPRWLAGTLDACGQDESLTVEFQIDETIRWEEAEQVLQLAFETSIEPEVFIRDAGTRIAIWRPDGPAKSDPFTIQLDATDEWYEILLTGTEPAEIQLNRGRVGQGTSGIAALRKRFPNTANSGAPGRTATFQIASETRFHWVLAAMKVLYVESDSVSSNGSLIQLNNLGWFPPLAEPYRTHGGVI